MWLGGWWCHQLPARSPHLWGLQMPLCWRCSGILFGTLALLVWLFTKKRLPALALSVPFALLMKGNLVQRIVVLICHLVPTFALAFYGRAGNITLLCAALLLAIFVFQRARSQVDVNQLASYNTAT